MYQAVIIGAGNIASEFDSPDNPNILTHAHAYQHNPAFHLKGFYDTDYKKAKKAADKWNCKAYETLEAAMTDTDVVSCCVPDQYHAQILKDVSVYHPNLVIAEKPFAVSITEGNNLQRIFAGKIPLLLNYSRRFLPEFQMLRKKVNHYGKFLKGVGYYGKGILHNGSHMIDLLIFLFGCVECQEILHPKLYDYINDPSVDTVLNISEGTFHMVAIDSRVATIFELDLFFEKARIRILNGGTIIEKYELQMSSTYHDYYNYVLTKRETVNYSHAMTGLIGNAEGFLDGTQELACDMEDGINVLKICMQIRGESF